MAPEDRLDRIEGKVDKLVEAIQEMIRLEASLAAHTTALERFGFRLDNIEARVEDVEKRVPIYELWVGWASKLALIVTTILVGALLSVVMVS